MKYFLAFIITASIVGLAYLSVTTENKKKEQNSMHYELGVLVAYNLILDANARGEKMSTDTLLARSKTFLTEKGLAEMYDLGVIK